MRGVMSLHERRRRVDDDAKTARSNQLSKVFYTERYHPIQAGSIDGTDVVPHDNAVSRALLCSSASLYDPFGDSKATGDPYCSVFVGRLSRFTTEKTLLNAMSKYGHVKNLRLVRHIVTGESCGYAFVEYERERDMRRAYKDAHHSTIDDHEVMVDYCRQLLMPGWVPRRLGGGLGGRKESGQLRFGGRERPFRAPLQQIPYESLKKLGIPLPPEGRYMSRFEVPSPPRRAIEPSEEKRRQRGGERPYSHEKRLKEDEGKSLRSSSTSQDDRNTKRHRHHRDRRSDDRRLDDEFRESKKRRHRRNDFDEISCGTDLCERWPMSFS